MSTSTNNFDTIESLIYKEGIRIQSVDVSPAADIMLITLNTGAVLKQRLSAHPGLKNAAVDDLSNFEIIAPGTGIHWPALDEDLSLKGFLRDELRNVITQKSSPAA